MNLLYAPLLVPQPIAPTRKKVSRPRSKDGLRVSKETYWKKYYNDPDFVYEWNNGYLEEKPVSKNATVAIYDWVVGGLRSYLNTHPIAKTLGLETGFDLELANKSTIRRPDLGIVLNSNPVPIAPKENSYHGTFDLCIEAVSDSNKKEIERDTVHKKREYAQAGVKEYYILDAIGNAMGFYRLNRWGEYEDIRPLKGDIIQSSVLPGFQFRISDLYRQPSPKELVEDEVYRGFVMVDYQRERERAERAERQMMLERQKVQQERLKVEQERLKVEQERQRAEQERQRAERLAAKLKELGISLD